MSIQEQHEAARSEREELTRKDFAQSQPESVATITLECIKCGASFLVAADTPRESALFRRRRCRTCL